MGFLLQLIVPSEVSQVLKEKNNIWHFPLFRMSVYGSLLFGLYDQQELSEHVTILNEVAKYWYNTGMKDHLLEAIFYTLFENEIVYDDTLEGWKDQGLTDEWFTKAIVRLSNTLYQIQEILNQKDE